MKKIMKKALSLLLVLALVVVPMTVMAAEGDYVAIPSWENCIYSGDTVTVDANTTTYFEIGTEGVSGTYDFVVEGTGDFDVAICGEGIANGHSDGYAEGTSLSAVDGKVETEITSYESTYGYACFSITNNTSESASYTCTVVFPEGSQGNPKAVTLAVGGTANVTVPAQTQYCVAVTLPQMYTEYQLTITGNTGFGYLTGYMPSWDTNGTYKTTVAAYYGPASFVLINNTSSEQTYTLALDNMPIGSSSNPDAVTVGTEITKAVDGGDYWYQWTPVVDGTLTISVNEEASSNDGWYVNVQSKSIQKSNYWDDAATFSFNVTADEPVIFGVSVLGLDPWGEISTYGFGSGNVVFTLSFDEKTFNDSGDGSGNDDETGSGSENTDGEEINENYYYKYQELTVGTNDIMPMFGYPTTLYKFVPTEAGEYLVTIDEAGATLGYYGSNEWFPFDNTENKTSTLTLEAKEANAPMLIGVSDAMLATLNISRVGDVKVEDGDDIIVYENVVTPEEFTFPGNAETLLDSCVDTYDDVVDEAVLGADGYYHLNDENGPVLFVNLNEEVMPLASMFSVAANNVNYTNALAEYIAVLPQQIDENGNPVTDMWGQPVYASYWYPLTVDLIEIFKEVGNANGWYGEDGFVGGTLDDAWMFACYYDEDITSLAPATDSPANDGATTDSTTPDSSASTSAPTTSAKTGDNVNVFAWVAVMMVGLAAVVVALKKRAR